MKTVLLFLATIALSSCTKTIEKPAVTIGEYSKQVVQINEVVNKLMNEQDVKVMNYMADGVEATRAIPCDAVGEECNAYYGFLNKVVDLTKDNELSEADRKELVDQHKKLQIELQKSDVKIQQQWKDYINSQGKKE